MSALKLQTPILLWLACLPALSVMADNLRIGLVGLDTSHSEQFTLRLNDPANPNHVPGARVVAAFPCASPDLPESASRIEGFTATLRDKFGVKMLGSIAEVCAATDAVMILSVDGRPHLDQAKEVIAGGKPFFLDKPVAASLKDAVEIYKLAEAAKVPLFSASATRWWPGVVEVANSEKLPARAVLSYGPAPLLPHHPDLFFYGIHSAEALFTVMGAGCLSVERTSAPDVSVVTGLWEGGRLGTLYALHTLPMGSTDYKLIRFGQEKITEQASQGDYTPLLREIIKFFQTRQPPVTAKQTLEIYAFMEAAQESKRQQGRPVLLRDVLTRAGAPEEWLPPDPQAK
ncbi:MAG: Gfo/Idh/MocA family oxidoreductase [Prosthecobacter sp.]|jgi:predicted dehydrogenase|nr:Gfo/Idh/MocA family oxidoreductase [Prosthecobacter sp.]